MTLRIAAKEMREMYRDGRFRAGALVILGLLLASLAAGLKHYHDLSAQQEAARRATRMQWVNQGRKNPHSAAHYGVYAFKPTTQLAVLDTGVDPYLGVAVWLEAHKQNEFKYRPAQDRTSVHRFGELTAAGILQVLLPLFIILFAFPAFAGEREQGTFRQVLSLGVRGRQLALGKALGIAAALAILLVPAAIIGVAAIALSTENGILADDLPRTALMVGAYLLYFAVFIGLSLAVSARASSSRLALVILLAFWTVNSLIASRAASDLAGYLAPTPSAIRFGMQLEQDLNEREGIDRRLEQRRVELMREHGVESVDALPINFSGISLQEGEEHANEVFDRHYGRLFDTFQRQNELYQAAGAVAPLIAVRSISMGLAGTDFAQHRHFTMAAEAYRRDLQRTLNDDIARNQKRGTVYLADASLWNRVPDFVYEAPGTGWVLRNYRGSIAFLLTWTFLAAGLAVGSAGRAKPE
jgi:ABC-2 type transport system permease protein